ncbi:MAG: hypothetical protein M1824_002570, partial [Vezdaea acicularis]
MPPNPSTNTTTSRASLAPSAIKPRQLAHLHAQLAQLQAHLSDTENLLRMTAVQAGCVRDLGGWTGGMFMAASKVLGEETVAGVDERARGGGNATAGGGAGGAAPKEGAGGK